MGYDVKYFVGTFTKILIIDGFKKLIEREIWLLLKYFTTTTTTTTTKKIRIFVTHFHMLLKMNKEKNTREDPHKHNG
jgi:hypothetical protein